jgi:hypothetical protein
MAFKQYLFSTITLPTMRLLEIIYLSYLIYETHFLINPLRLHLMTITFYTSFRVLY